MARACELEIVFPMAALKVLAVAAVTIAAVAVSSTLFLQSETCHRAELGCVGLSLGLQALIVAAVGFGSVFLARVPPPIALGGVTLAIVAILAFLGFVSAHRAVIFSPSPTG